MGDPLSILGAAVGVTSLIMQMTDECIKGFKIISEAANMPERHNFLCLRLQMEQQRFLNFGLEAGTLYADGKLCDTLQVHRPLLVSILAEIKTSMEKFASDNGKYEKLIDRGNEDGENQAQLDIMELLCLSSQDKNQAKGGKSTGQDRVLTFGKGIARTGRRLRVIAVEPKRLIWATIDKDKFERLICRMQDLNSFLIALLDKSQVYRLQETINSSYLELLQIRNDVESLSTLVKALAFVPKQPQKYAYCYPQLDFHLPSGAAMDNMMAGKTEEYLKQLVELKIRLAEAGQLDNKGPVDANFNNFPIRAPLSLGEFKFMEERSNSNEPRLRNGCLFRGSTVWVEWTHISTVNYPDGDIDNVRIRISLLTDLLSRVMPTGFRAPKCLGYLENIKDSEEARFGMVFKNPSTDTPALELFTLHQLLGETRIPSLSKRMKLCATLARSVFDFHSVNWLHKGLRSDNILFFASSRDTVDLGSLYIAGFELSRPSIVEEMTEKPRFDPLQDIYRHPHAQSSHMDGNYRKCYDIYSLGVVLIEIALWNRIDKIVGLENLSTIKPLTLQGLQQWLLGKPITRKGSSLPNIPDAGSCLQQLDSVCGEVFCNIVQCCLTVDAVEISECLEPGSIAALRIQRITEQDIVRRLESIQFALGGCF